MENLRVDDGSDIARLSNADPQAEHHRLEQHPLEYELTRRYLDAYLPPHGDILEVGAATGRYTFAHETKIAQSL